MTSKESQSTKESVLCETRGDSQCIFVADGITIEEHGISLLHPRQQQGELPLPILIIPKTDLCTSSMFP